MRPSVLTYLARHVYDDTGETHDVLLQVRDEDTVVIYTESPRQEVWIYGSHQMAELLVALGEASKDVGWNSEIVKIMQEDE